MKSSVLIEMEKKPVVLVSDLELNPPFYQSHIYKVLSQVQSQLSLFKVGQRSRLCNYIHGEGVTANEIGAFH